MDLGKHGCHALRRGWRRGQESVDAAFRECAVGDRVELGTLAVASPQLRWHIA